MGFDPGQGPRTGSRPRRPAPVPWLRDPFDPGANFEPLTLPAADVPLDPAALDPVALATARRILEAMGERGWRDVLLLRGAGGALRLFEPHLLGAAREADPDLRIPAVVVGDPGPGGE